MVENEVMRIQTLSNHEEGAITKSIWIKSLCHMERRWLKIYNNIFLIGVLLFMYQSPALYLTKYIYLYLHRKQMSVYYLSFCFFFPPQCMQIIKVEPINFKITCIENFANPTNRPQNSQNLHIKLMFVMCKNVKKIIIYGLSQREHPTFWCLLSWRFWTLWADSKTSEKDLFCYWVLERWHLPSSRGETSNVLQELMEPWESPQGGPSPL